MPQPFRFKQFQVFDQHSTMRVGTDSVLLGAWAKLPNHGLILDVGTGCGILALMAAQKTQAKILAIDIDKASIEEASQNFKNSLWASRLSILQTEFEQYAYHHPHSVDHIISNPPYFINSLKTKHSGRNKARHAPEGFEEKFIESLATTLSPQGKASIIQPADRIDSIMEILTTVNLFLTRLCKVFPHEGSRPTRVLLELSRCQQNEPEQMDIIIHVQGNTYTPQYKELTGDFYLFLKE